MYLQITMVNFDRYELCEILIFVNAHRVNGRFRILKNYL